MTVEGTPRQLENNKLIIQHIQTSDIVEYIHLL